MKESLKEKQKKEIMRDLIFLGITLVTAIILLSIFPDKREAVITTSWNFLIEMILILPAVMVLMGLFAVFVPKEMVVKYLGKSSGIKGIFISIFMGALPTGPLYVAFPMASALLKKGARISNIIIFLSAWACIKIPQELVELQFLGPKFMAMRLSLTIIFVILMGVFIEQIILWSNKKESKV
ncbi:permease [Kosmotoga olearia]|uniref:Permease n=1 Tax=Kosmotoga olearia (strain ATCC BAA-1733 / DSM 21960 / TBF 19.5.1) TaxID=521045 RepID=C5CII6_KOSOT|nr:permease [Kosmotoga olearia]ACR79849.1 conserved hypothetical protein [Kosmotoga olearia TBF 19.5.1]